MIGDPTFGDAILDRLVHHAAILELNTESYRRRVAVSALHGGGHDRGAAASDTTGR